MSFTSSNLSELTWLLSLLENISFLSGIVLMNLFKHFNTFLNLSTRFFSSVELLIYIFLTFRENQFYVRPNSFDPRFFSYSLINRTSEIQFLRSYFLGNVICYRHRNFRVFFRSSILVLFTRIPR